MKVNAALSISHSNKTAVAVVYISEDIPGMGIPFYTGLEYYKKALFRFVMKTLTRATAASCLFIAGSRGMTGAAYLSCMGALRSGSGLLLWEFPNHSSRLWPLSSLRQ